MRCAPALLFAISALSAVSARAQDASTGSQSAVTEAGPVRTPPPGTVRTPAAPAVREQPVRWRAEWPRFSLEEATLTVALGALVIGAELLPVPTTTAVWQGTNAFDEGARDGLRLREHESRQAARTASEVLRWILVGIPIVVDSAAAAGLGHQSWDAMLQMGLISIEAYTLALMIWKATALLARRERPISRECASDPSSPQCAEDHTASSFFSNHTVTAFTGASLTCLHHTHLPLFGSEIADISTCATAMGAAVTVGLLRVMSDYEHLSDVLVGAAVGLVSGYLVPWLIHYQGGARAELREMPLAVIPAPLMGPGDTYGLQLGGAF